MISKLYVKNKSGVEYELDNEGIKAKNNAQDVELNEIQETIRFLSTSLEFLKAKANIIDVKVEATGTEYKDENADINLSTIIKSPTGKQSYVANSILVTDSDIEDTHVALTAKDDVSVANLKTTGTLAKKVSNSGISVNTNGDVTFNGGSYEQAGYNAIEIGLNNTAPKSITIKDLDFKAKMSNNAILIFNTVDNAVINIENCHFADVSNCVRLSNRDNVHVTLNIKNCTCDKWDTSDDWAGMVILEDYTSKTLEETRSVKRFGPDKVTINIENCTGPFGKIKPVTDLSTICSTNNHETQVIYICEDKGDNSHPYDVSMYPVINIK